MIPRDGSPERIRTALGRALAGNVPEALFDVEPGTVDLVVTSPPFAVYSDDPLRCLEGARFVDFFLQLMEQLGRLLRPRGSIVLELGTTWLFDRPEKAVHVFDLMCRLCREQGWHLVQELYWYNPALLETPVEWVETDHTRFRDSISLVWWLAKTLSPNVDTGRVDARPPAPNRRGNLLFFRHGAERKAYERSCAQAGLDPHDESFPESFPEFFISLLTEPGDRVLDPFAGSCTTGVVAERLARHWICVEREEKYLAAAALRFPQP